MFYEREKKKLKKLKYKSGEFFVGELHTKATPNAKFLLTSPINVNKPKMEALENDMPKIMVWKQYPTNHQSPKFTFS